MGRIVLPVILWVLLETSEPIAYTEFDRQIMPLEITPTILMKYCLV
jgi:hypothetical protein